jgi:hypothetical protein
VISCGFKFCFFKFNLYRYGGVRRRGGAVQVELCLTHSLKAPGFKPLPLNINPGFKMCLSKFNLRHYTAVAAIVVGGGCVQAESS